MSEIPERLRAGLADRYRFLQEIGRGGMATVYLALDLKHGRQVAIKVLHESLVPTALEGQRFLREIQIVARLNHPQILPLHDSGAVDSLLFFVMPFMGCETLRERLRSQGRLAIDEVIRIGRAVAAALDYAHRQDVIHRDIKPENILMREGQPVVADFGIARAVLSDAADGVTGRGMALGTVAYMSPEQASGETVDGATDQYALACVLYELLTGRPPFVGATTRATLMQHLTAAAPPPRSIRATIPPGLEEAVLRALAKERRERFPSMAQFAEALDRSSAPVVGVPVTESATIAVLPFTTAGSDPDTGYLGDGLAEELTTALSRVPRLGVASRSTVLGTRGRHDDPRAWGRELGVACVLAGSVRRAGDRIRVGVELIKVADGHLVWSERFDREWGDLFELQDDMARRIVTALRASLPDEALMPARRRQTESLTAYHLYLRGRFAWNQRTAEGVTEAIRLFEAALGADGRYAAAHAGLADSHALKVDYGAMQVKEGFERARVEAKRALELDDELAEAHTSLGWVYFIYDWDWEAADRELRRAIELDPGYAVAHQWYAWLLLALGRVDEAIAEGRLSADLDPASLSARRSLGWLYVYARRPELALPHLHAALAMNPSLEETNFVLGLAYEHAGDLGAAEAAYRSAEASGSSNLRATAALGRLAVQRGERALAEDALARLEQIAAERYVSPVDFVTLHVALGHVDEAFGWLDRALEDRRGWLAYLRAEPVLDPLRGDSRFAALLRKMRLD